MKSILVVQLEFGQPPSSQDIYHYKFKSGDREHGEKMWQEARDIFAELGAQKEVERMKDLPA